MRRLICCLGGHKLPTSLPWEDTASRVHGDESQVWDPAGKVTERTHTSKLKTNEPPHDKTSKMTYAQRKLRSAWASAQYDQSSLCEHSVQLRIQAFFLRTVKTLIRLGGCPGCSESALGAQVIFMFLSCAGSNGSYFTLLLYAELHFIMFWSYVYLSPMFTLSVNPIVLPWFLRMLNVTYWNDGH